MFDKILIANRGEIALRVIRACRELGIKTLAIYSEADEQSLHVQFADEAICIGRAPASESYLRADRIFSAAELGNVDAIHPGYGFLSESSMFAEQCADCKINFIGPRAEVIRQMGDKACAKEMAKKAKVPIVPGSEGIVDNENEGLRIAEIIGFPIIIKAVAGGGGKGMRLVNNSVSFSKEFNVARAEAEKNFGNGAVYIEKFVEEPRHIEIQIVGDKYGKIVHLGERDCSIQRRYQKIIEEAPSGFLDTGLREKIGEAAIRLAKQCGYENAGTVEFLVDKNGNFYFMEMNTRIQVEHGVTEEATGIDLVDLQLRIAAGEKIPFDQKHVKFIKHAIECRINAEDPERNFTPCPGEIILYYAPGGNGIRIDSHVYGGYKIPQYYDSMIAKLIATGNTREVAINRMNRALGEYVVRGISTTIPFTKAIMSDVDFRAGNVTTKFIEEFMKRNDYGVG
ncbi:MAG: acetyl-CoA carboxylase biotin carboxylase subunit [Puniceicoccales bacterium]|jgi:acetyl-CoA carboxylase biotin carboxylase subunit|nr:acetyl-CoA carboxylase biotin carboxylase subunit [Puniceicoccales bacterium]